MTKGVFTRNLSTQVGCESNGDITIVSEMTDQFHHFRLTIKAGRKSLVIKDLNLEMLKSPTPLCSKIIPELKSLVGVGIGRGLTGKVLEILGGHDGCINLKNMLLTSLPLAINIQAAYDTEGSESGQEKMHRRLEGTCMGYSLPYEETYPQLYENAVMAK
ncbi:MAG TPA: DUF2889 domain-containing protein [Bacillota bacterium]|nr:DUF2889 domain-containing protein [Bacillota bacterium]